MARSRTRTYFGAALFCRSSGFALAYARLRPDAQRLARGGWANIPASSRPPWIADRPSSDGQYRTRAGQCVPANAATGRSGRTALTARQRSAALNMSAPMVRWLMILAMLFCSLQPAEPASAHVSDSAAAFTAAFDGGGTDSREPHSKIAHAGHHHCQVASAPGQAVPAAATAFASLPVFAAAAVALASYASPPLLDPPLA